MQLIIILLCGAVMIAFIATSACCHMAASRDDNRTGYRTSGRPSYLDDECD